MCHTIHLVSQFIGFHYPGKGPLECLLHHDSRCNWRTWHFVPPARGLHGATTWKGLTSKIKTRDHCSWDAKVNKRLPQTSHLSVKERVVRGPAPSSPLTSRARTYPAPSVLFLASPSWPTKHTMIKIDNK